MTYCLCQAQFRRKKAQRDFETTRAEIVQAQSVLRMWLFKHKYRHFRSLFALPTAPKELELHTLLHLGSGAMTGLGDRLMSTTTPHDRILSDADVERINWLKKGVLVRQLEGNRSAGFKLVSKKLTLSANCKKVTISGTATFSMGSVKHYDIQNKVGFGVGHVSDRFKTFKAHSDMDMGTELSRRRGGYAHDAPPEEACFSLLLSETESVDIVAPQPEMLSAKGRARSGSSGAVNQKTSVESLLGDGQDAPSGYVMADCYLALQAIVLSREDLRFKRPRDFAWIQTKARIAEVCAQLNLQPHEIMFDGWKILKTKRPRSTTGGVPLSPRSPRGNPVTK